MGTYEGVARGRDVIFQKAGQRKVDRKDHVWRADKTHGYKCVLCGALTKTPPPHPTPMDWMPDHYELVTKDDELLCPREK